MENDLFFTLIEADNWKVFTKSGNFEPDTYKELKYIECFDNSEVEKAANIKYSNSSQLLLIVIDPLRVQVPMKKEKEGELSVLKLFGVFSIDAVIDRIKLIKSEKGRYDVRIKHYD